MKKIILATANKHKLKEVKEILFNYEVLSLEDIGFNEDIDETGDTTEENAKIKAVAILNFCKEKNIDVPIIADDTGLFVVALGGEPGVHSARYAGDHNDEANRQLVLKNLQGKTDRTAYFQSTICYASSTEIRFFYGKTFGKITTEKIGSDNFGYDCLFFSDDLQKTFGQATDDEKNSVSHRGRAVKSLKDWLDSQN